MGLVLLAAFTLGIWLQIRRAEQARIEALKIAQADTAVDHVKDRMQVLEQVLLSAAGYLSRGSLPTRAEWQTYVKNLNLPTAYPGIQGLGFAEWIPRTELPTHLKRVRGEGFPDYTVISGGPLPPDPEGCSSIIYLEPMDARNQRAFGQDMWVEATRREAMARARDTGLVALSGRVTLYQETSTDIQTGTLLYAPVFRQGLPLDTVAQRRKAFRGWAYFPFRMADLIQAALSHTLIKVNLDLFDRPSTGPGQRLYGPDSAPSESGEEPALVRSFEVAGRTWMLHVQPNAAFPAAVGWESHWEVLVGGLVGSLLLFLLLVTIKGAEGRARMLADRRGEELLATESRFRALFEKAPLGMAILESVTGRYLAVNQSLSGILGYSSEELLERTFLSVTHPENQNSAQVDIHRLESGEISEYQKEKRFIHKDGHTIHTHLHVVRLPAGPTEATRHLSIVEDITEAKRLEDELRASEERFRGIFDVSPDPISLSRLSDGALLEVNQAWCALTGIPRVEALGHSMLALGVWVSPQEREELMVALHLHGMVESREAALRRRDGSERRVLFNGKVMNIRNEDLILIMAKDLTERKRVEAETERQAKRYAQIMSTSLDAIHVIDKSGRLKEWNPAFLTHLGYSEEEAANLRVSDWDRQRSEAELLEEIISLIHAPRCFETIHRRKDGTLRTVEINGSGMVLDGEELLYAAARDVTERNQAEQALQESEARFRRVVEHAVDGIYLNDIEGRILLCNPEACRSTGYSMEELLRLRVKDLDPCLREEEHAMAWRTLAPGQQIAFEGRIHRKDGTTFPVEVHIGLLGEAEPRQILAMVRDTSDREQMKEADLRARKAESLVLMAGSIAHDFNNLFQALLGNLELAQLASRGQPDVARPLDVAAQVLHRAVSLSWKMLDFSGRAIAKLEPVDLPELLSRWAPELGRRLGEGTRLELELGVVPKVHADPDKLRTVLEALLDNAREAMDEAGVRDGHVRLKLGVDFGEDRPGILSSGVWAVDPPLVPATVCLELSDEGPGTPPDVLARMFDPFFTTKAMGRGLGLASALGLLKAHSAGVHVLPGEDKGLVFRIHFPPAGS